MSTEDVPPSNSTPSVFEQMEQYNWREDAEFQTGLSSILGSGHGGHQTEETVARAKCFYFSRKFNVDVDFDGYDMWLRHRHHPDAASDSVPNGSTEHVKDAALTTDRSAEMASSEASSSRMAPESASGVAPYPTSFAQIVELISTGQPIPGIKDIPSTILDGQRSQSNNTKRRKPWEKDEPSVSEPPPTEQQEASSSNGV